MPAPDSSSGVTLLVPPPTAFPPVPPKRRSRSRERMQTYRIKRGPLTPGMFAYAEWLTLDCVDVPSRVARRVAYQRITKKTITDALLRELEHRPEFVAYCDELQQGPLETARAKFVNRLPEYIDAHHDALVRATDANDYRAMAQITEPALDRVLPKKADNVAATQVHITLTPQQLAGVTTYEAPAVDVEVVTQESADV